MQWGAQSCRRVVARSAKAHTSHTWIDDDLLDSAVQRFARSVEQSQRRYGSHTPGPLECRRRLEKRRMGAASVPGSSTERNWFGFPDLDALFRQRARDDNWTWKPPSSGISKQKISLNEQDETRKCGEQTINTLMLQLSACDNVKDIRTTLGSTTLSAKEFAAFSANAFERLLSAISERPSAASELNLEDIGELLYFLQSDLEHPESRNLEFLLKEIKGRSLTEMAFLHLIAVIQDKVQLATLDVFAVPHILGTIPALQCKTTSRDEQLLSLLDSIHTYMSKDTQKLLSSLRTNYLTAAARFLAAIAPSHQSLSMMINLSVNSAKITVRTAQTCADYFAVWAQSIEERDSPDADKSPIAGWLSEREDVAEAQSEALVRTTLTLIQRCKEDAMMLNRLCRWLSMLRKSLLHQPTFSQNLWNAVYPKLAANWRPHELTDYFKTFYDNTDIVRVLFDHWYIPEAFEKLRTDKSHQSPDEVLAFTTSVTDTLEKRFSAYHDHQHPIYQPFVAAVDTITAHTGLVDSKYIEETFNLFARFGNPYHVTATFNRLIDRGNRVKTTHLSADTIVLLINHFVNNQKLKLATRIFLDTPSARLEHNLPLFFALLDEPSPNVAVLFTMLNRSDGGNSVPLSSRSDRENALDSNRVDLVNTMAFTLARAPEFAPRQAYRAVWQCYRYLRDRRATLDVNMTRALVHAGVTRYLKAGLWVSTMRFTWILKWVRMVEGDEVASRLDVLAGSMRKKIRDEQERARYEADEVDGTFVKFRRPIWGTLSRSAIAAEKADQSLRNGIRSRVWKKNKPWLFERRLRRNGGPGGIDDDVHAKDREPDARNIDLHVRDEDFDAIRLRNEMSDS